MAQWNIASLSSPVRGFLTGGSSHHLSQIEVLFFPKGFQWWTSMCNKLSVVSGHLALTATWCPYKDLTWLEWFIMSCFYRLLLSHTSLLLYKVEQSQAGVHSLTPCGLLPPTCDLQLRDQFVLREFSFFVGILTEALEIFRSAKYWVNRLLSGVETKEEEALNWPFYQLNLKCRERSTVTRLNSPYIFNFYVTTNPHQNSPFLISHNDVSSSAERERGSTNKGVFIRGLWLLL